MATKINSWRWVRAAFFLTVLWSGGGVSASETPSTRLPHIILISVDGLIPASYNEPQKHGLQIPTIRKMAREGAYSPGIDPVMPSATSPSHASIATGARPSAHGITTDLALDASTRSNEGRRWFAEDIKVPTLWDRSKAENLRVALVAWPATAGARVDALLPDYWRDEETLKPEDLKLLKALSTPGLLAGAELDFPGFSSKFLKKESRDEALTDVAIHALKHLKPQLLMLRLCQVDSAQHRYGLWSSQARAALENADAQIRRLEQAAREAGLFDRAIFAIVSDHGFAPVSKSVRPGALLRQKGLISVDPQGRVTGWKAAVAASGGSAYIYLRDPNDDHTQRILLENFGPMTGEPNSGIAKIGTKQDIATMGGDLDAFLALNGAPGYDFVDGYAGDLIEKSASLAAHGYFPTDPAMKTALIFYGSGIRHLAINEGRLIDIAPTVASWLDFGINSSEGRVLPGLRH